jgi:glucose-1-phosphate adenylyltransferase
MLNHQVGFQLDSSPFQSSRLANRTVALVLAGGRGSRLHELTTERAKPAVHFGGNARIIDFTLSNALNSGFRKIAVATQYEAHGLIRHLQRGWNFLRPERNEFLDLLPASQGLRDQDWYQGTADAVRRNIDILDSYDIDYALILAGDHVYKMDYSVMLRQHVERGADVTVSCIAVPLEDARGYGVVQVNPRDRITGFQEKPTQPTPLPDDPLHCLASMGVYVFNWAFLRAQLLNCSPETLNDFGADLIPSLVEQGRAVAHRFTNSCVRDTPDQPAYWRDVGTLDAYWQANIDLTRITPSLNLWDRGWPVWTHQENAPPAKFVHAEPRRKGSAIETMIGGGCIISGSEICNSLVSPYVHTHSYSTLRESVVLPDVSIGRSARLTRAIIDRGVRIPDGLVVGENRDQDAQWFRVTDGGVTLITQTMVDAWSKAR